MIPEDKIRLIELEGGAVIQKMLRGWAPCASESFYYIDKKGNTSHWDYVGFETVDEAYNFIVEVNNYWAAPLPDKDVYSWLETLNGDEIKIFEEFGQLVIQKEFKKAQDYLALNINQTQSRIIPQRIMWEIWKTI